MRCLAMLSLAVVVAACGGDETGNGGSGPGASGGGGGVAGAGGTGGGGGSGASGGGGAPPCTATELGDAVRTESIGIAGATSGRAITAQSGSGSVVAWAAADGIHVTPLDAVDQRSGMDLVTAGSQVFGAASNGDEVTLLVSRAPDYMTFVRLDMNGAVLASTDLVGGGDHQVEGVEWFGEFASTGRLVARDDGSYAAYHALHRRWPDMIGHQGDTLRLLDAQGVELGGGWGWGCSHSMDQRLAFGPNGLVPICIADCYPGKGIYFNHNDAQITDDPSANCAGGFGTDLGGLVATSGGFMLVYQDTQGGAHLGVFDTQGAALSDRALSVEGSSRLAHYDDGLLLGSNSGGDTTLQLLDTDGMDVGAPATVTTPLPDQDFESRSDGEVAWGVASGDSLTVVRVRVCTP